MKATINLLGQQQNDGDRKANWHLYLYLRSLDLAVLDFEVRGVYSWVQQGIQ